MSKFESNEEDSEGIIIHKQQPDGSVKKFSAKASNPSRLNAAIAKAKQRLRNRAR